MLFGIVTRKRLTTLKMRFSRGSSWISILISILVITANIKLFEQLIISLLPSWVLMQYVYLLSIPSYLLLCYLLGWIDEIKGIWKNENSYNVAVTPESIELVENNRIMFKDIKEIKEAIINDLTFYHAHQ